MKRTFLISGILVSSMLFSEPPRYVPPHLYNKFTMNGAVKISSLYIDGTISEGHEIFYKMEDVLKLIKEVQKSTTFYYGQTDLWLYQALQKYPIKGKNVGIYGSVKPIYESVCLAYGGIPVTVEYNKWKTDHPKLTCMTPEEYDSNPVIFDCAFSISSFEHDGLGRYGDPIDPNGDLKAMKKAKKMIKPGGLLFLAVPVGRDEIAWNAHRIYGIKRLPLLLEGWQVIDCFGIKGLRDPILYPNSKRDSVQPVFVLKNI